jgi:CDP-glucose 4,6-dehydratase
MFNDLSNFFKGKRIFITGHTGFKGSWLTYILSKAGAEIKGYSLSPDTELSLYNYIESSINVNSIIADINDYKKLEIELISFQPDFVFHLAAQPLVRKSYNEPLYTFNTNIIGTANLLNAIVKLNKSCTCILVTTDKVYENNEWVYPYRETDKLGGYDPYSASKACAELIISSYQNSFFNIANFSSHKKSIASVRAGNVIGGGDWSENRLIPDIVRSISNGQEIIIRNPYAVRPWQHVLEPVFGYLQLAFALDQNPIKYSGAWNFGPYDADNLPVLAIAKKAIEIWGEGAYKVQIDTNAPHEAGLLKLDISKVVNILNWKPHMNTLQAITKSIQWYKNFYKNKNTVIELLDSDINFYKSLYK